MPEKPGNDRSMDSSQPDHRHPRDEVERHRHSVPMRPLNRLPSRAPTPETRFAPHLLDDTTPSE